jgi:adenosylcobinamide kinase / adenosylcobinamide-phosphate guanylyltransferase
LIVLITGGARSGKSRYAQEMAERSGKRVLFVATAQAGDDEMRRRILAHQRSRPSSWRTLEAPFDVGRSITEKAADSEVILLDCITLLINNVIGPLLSADGTDIDEIEADRAVTVEIDGLITCLKTAKADVLVVTNEVGLGLVPDNKLGRVYRDLLGKANQVLAAAADEVCFMVSGLPLKLKP